MAEAKLRPIQQTVSEYIRSQPKERQADCKKLNAIFKKITGKTPVMWYGGMVGYGEYAYQYPSGHSGVCFQTGFSARKTALTLYPTSGLANQTEYLKKLGKFKTSKACLYIKRLADVDEKVLVDLLTDGYKRWKESQKK